MRKGVSAGMSQGGGHWVLTLEVADLPGKNNMASFLELGSQSSRLDSRLSCCLGLRWEWQPCLLGS